MELETRPSVIVRLVHGVTDHFIYRANDWIMTSMLLWVGMAIWMYPEVFHLPSFALLAQYGSAHTWAVFAILMGLVRLSALIVNGTFPEFIWSPHFRTLGAGLTCFFWFQLMLTLFTGIATAPMLLAVVPHLFLFDLFNAYMAAGEAGIAERRRRDGRT